MSKTRNEKDEGTGLYGREGWSIEIIKLKMTTSDQELLTNLEGRRFDLPEESGEVDRGLTQ